MNKKISFPIAIIIIVVCAVVVGGIAIWQYLAMPREEEKISEGAVLENETADWKVYRNEEYGFEFKYPKEWGDATIEQAKNFGHLEGEYFEILFSNKQQIDPDGYNNIPHIASFSTDWQVFEVPAPFDIKWKENQSAEDFCEEFIESTLTNNGCKKINENSNIFIVNYAYYIEMGMFGDGNRINFARSAFVELEDEKFKGLILDLFFSKLIDSTYHQKNISEITNIAVSNFNQVISSKVNKIETFNKILLSFKMTEN